MRFSERMKRTIYVAPVDRSTRPVTYGTPVAYRVNVLPMTADTMVEAYGVGFSEKLSIVCDRMYGDDIHELDLVYYEVEPPDDADVFASGADYVVLSKLPCIGGVSFVLDRKVKGGK